MDVRRVLVVLLVAQLAVPTAMASRGSDVSGDLVFERDAILEGHVDLRVTDGGLDLGPAVAHGPVVLSWSSARGFWTSMDWLVGPDGTSVQKPGRDRSNVTLEPATSGEISIDECGRTCTAFAFPLPDASVSTDRVVSGPLARAQTDLYFYADMTHGLRQDAGSGISRHLPAGSFVVPGGTPRFEGPIGLLIRDAAATLRTRDGAVLTLDALARRAPVAPGIGGDRLVDVHESWVFLTLDRVTLASPADRALLYSSSGDAILDGTLSSASVSGSASVDGRERSLDHVPFSATGVFSIHLGQAPERLASFGVEHSRASFSGRATDVSIADERIVAASPRLPAAAAPLATVAILVAIAACLRHAGLAALYSRISRARVLLNPRRLAIYDLVRADPGLTALEVSRRVRVARMVVHHHLRMLQAHGFVTVRVVGRARLHFPPEASPPLVDLAHQLALEGASRRRIATAVAELPGEITQRALASTTGYSPRLVSYHLGQLESLGFVTSTDRRPRAYSATPRLREALTASAGPQESAITSAGP